RRAGNRARVEPAKDGCRRGPTPASQWTSSSGAARDVGARADAIVAERATSCRRKLFALDRVRIWAVRGRDLPMRARGPRFARWGGVAAAFLSLNLCRGGVAHADAYAAALARAVSAKERALEANDPPHWEETLRLFAEADGIRSTKESKFE